MTTGERIKARRQELGMTQSELGERLGIQKSAISKIERGAVVNLKRDTIARLCTVLDCTPSYLMGWETENEYTRQVNEAAEMLRMLSPDGLKTVLSLLQQLTAGRE